MSGDTDDAYAPGMTHRPSALILAFLASTGVVALSAVSWTAAYLALPLAAYLLLRIATLRPARQAAAALAVALVAAASTGLPPSRGTGAVLPFAAILLLAWAVGVSLARQHENASRRLAERTRTAEAAAERGRCELAEQRLAMARDLHDVVAHHLSVIAVQAGYGSLVGAEAPARAVSALDVIASTSRQALDEVRGLVDVLRDDTPGRGAATRPAPGLADLSVLADNAARAGVQVDIRVSGIAHTISPGIDVAAYRIVQEALTNVVRHAGVNHAEVLVRHAADQVQLQIRDSGTRLDRAAAGNGLRGIHERAAACGGTAVTGHGTAGGFEVVATLPVNHAMVPSA